MTGKVLDSVHRNRDLWFLLVTLAAGLVLVYLGRAAFFHYASYMSAGLGSIILGINGADPSIANEFIRPEASLMDNVLLFAGCALIFTNAGLIRMGRL